MTSARESAQRAAREQVVTRLTRAGLAPEQLADIEREILWWTWSRVQAVQNRSLLLHGQGIAWGSTGYAQLVDVDVPRPGPGRVTVQTDASVVSPGTERAQYLRLPNTAVGLLGRPGYSAAGVIVSIGRGVEDLSVGDRVAVAGVPHASLAVAPSSAAFRIPNGISGPEAAMVQLGVIAAQGVVHGRIADGSRFAVVGGGLVGALALRIGIAQGGVGVAVVARSREKESAALAGGAQSFVTSEDGAAAIAADVVIESTGDPEGVLTAIRAAAPGGRIVLLGSPRGVTSHVPIDLLRERRLTLVGAHVDTLDQASSRTGRDERRTRGEHFLELVAQRRVRVDDLAGPAIDPRDAGPFYRRLTSDRSLVGAHFDWTLLPDNQRCRRGHLLRIPNILAKGVDARDRPLRPRPGLAKRLAIGDPFEGAQGRVRFGILGCGDIATANSGAIGLAPNAEVIACYDPVRRLAESLARPHGAAVTDSAEALCARQDVDAVVICAPHHLHAPLATIAIEAGRHVVVEKPLTNDWSSAVDLVRAAASAGVVLSVCFPQRFEPATTVAKHLVQRGLLGDFEGAAVSLYLDKTPAYWIGGFSGRSPSDWRSSRAKAGGGVLIMNLSHHIDLVRHLAGVDVENITAVTDATADGDAIESEVIAGLTFANGAVGSIVGGSSVRGVTGAELRLWGTDGHVALEPKPRVYPLGRMDGLRPGRWQSFGALPIYSARSVFFTRFSTAVTTGQPVDVTADDGLAVQAVMEATYRSANSGRRVSVTDLLEAAR